jgi:hypothetical protein
MAGDYNYHLRHSSLADVLPAEFRAGGAFIPDRGRDAIRAGLVDQLRGVAQEQGRHQVDMGDVGDVQEGNDSARATVYQALLYAPAGLLGRRTKSPKSPTSTQAMADRRKS